jgi:hypothetical protein
VALLIYLDISGFIFVQENISKKTFLSSWAEPEGRPAPAPAQQWPNAAAARAPLPRLPTSGGHLSPPPPVAPSRTRARVRAAPCPAPLSSLDRTPRPPPSGFLSPAATSSLPLSRNPSRRAPTPPSPNPSSTAAPFDLHRHRLPADEETTRRTARR